MAGISDKAIKTSYAENKYRFNEGTELQNKEFRDGTGLEMYDAGFRRLDPQLGRFDQIDPLADKFSFISTYQYAGNNPILNNDPTGSIIRSNGPHENVGIQAPYPINSGEPNGSDLITNYSAYGGGNNQESFNNIGYGDNGGSAGSNGGTLANQAGASGDPGDPASAYVALQNLLGNPISPTDTYFAQLLYSATFAGQISDVTAKLTPDGMVIGGTSVESGAAVSLSYSFAQIADNINTFLGTLDGDGGQGSGGGLSEGIENVQNSLTLVDLTTITPMEQVSKYVAGSVYGINDFSKAKSLINLSNNFKGVSIGLGILNVAATGLDMITNPDGPQLHNYIDLVTGGLSIAFPLFGAIYGILDLGSSFITGESISKHIQDAIED
jgi:RHS repeat-associated protein